MLVAVERNGPVRTALVNNDSVESLEPWVIRLVDPNAHLMTDQLGTYKAIGKGYRAHQHVNHGDKEFARGDVHNNTAESFNSMVERTKNGVFHFWSKKHLRRYLHELEFRWNQREPVLKQSKKGKPRIEMKTLPVLTMIRSLLSKAPCCQIRRSANGGIFCPNN